MAKVLKIVTLNSDLERALWAAAERVFLLPSYEQVFSALRNESVASLVEWQELLFRDKEPFSGPGIQPRYYRGQLWSISIVTDTSSRVLTLRRVYPYLTIEFPGGSLAAAGELIEHFQSWADSPEGGWLQEAGINVHLDDGTTVEILYYDGPTHADLGRARWDTDWRARNPELAAAVPID